MAEKFDPYYQWLGIPPKDQPPSHYRLLGIEEFESNPEVIEAIEKYLTTARTTARSYPPQVPSWGYDRLDTGYVK